MSTIAQLEHLATDVGLWMALPAFAPAVMVVAVVVYVATRDRRKHDSGPTHTVDDNTAPFKGDESG